MSMGATVVEYVVNPEHAEELIGRVQQHLLPAARQANGYRGFLLLDQGDGKRLALVLFDSEETAQAARELLSPIGREHIYPLMQGSPRGAPGTVIISDGVFAEPASA